MDWKKLELLQEKHNELGISKSMDYDKFYLYSIISNSAQIEGSTLTNLESQILLEDGLTPKGREIVFVDMNIDLRDAYVRAISYAKEKREVSVSFLQELSSLVMRRTGREFNSLRGSWSESKGDFRLHSVTAGYEGYSYVDYNKVGALTEKLCVEINARLKSVNTLEEIYTLAFDSHYNLVTIHPWGDGNGRMSRLLMNYIEFYKEVIPTRLNSEDRQDYIESLKKSRETNSLIPEREFIFCQQIKNLETSIKQKEKENNSDFCISF